ncbi:MAG: hypothetical protein Q8P67_13630, partial [archaeon]|nr:hypothetical protein [archaeon]
VSSVSNVRGLLKISENIFGEWSPDVADAHRTSVALRRLEERVPGGTSTEKQSRFFLSGVVAS